MGAQAHGTLNQAPGATGLLCKAWLALPHPSPCSSGPEVCHWDSWQEITAFQKEETRPSEQQFSLLKPFPPCQGLDTVLDSVESQRLEGSLRVVLLVCGADAMTEQWARKEQSAFPSCSLGPALTAGERHHSHAYAWPSAGSC